LSILILYKLDVRANFICEYWGRMTRNSEGSFVDLEHRLHCIQHCTLAHTRLLAGVQGTSFRRAHTGEGTASCMKGLLSGIGDDNDLARMDERTTTLALAVRISCLVSD